MGPHYCYGGLYISCIVMLVVVPLYAIIIVELLTYRLSRSVRYVWWQRWDRSLSGGNEIHGGAVLYDDEIWETFQGEY